MSTNSEGSEEFRMELITPEIAKAYLVQNTHNRDVRKGVVSAYATDMRNGDWHWNGDSIRRSKDGTVLDGQHRLLACIEAGVPFRTLVIDGLPNETQDTMDTGIIRRYTDLLKLRGEVNYNPLAATVRAVAAWGDGRMEPRNARSFTRAELDRTLEKYPWLRDGMPILKRVSKATGLPAAASGVLWWAFMEIDPDDAEAFFDRLASDQGHRDGDPITTLRRVLIKNREDRRGTRSIRYLMALVIKAWNKYRDGEEMHQLQFRVGGAKPESFPEPK